VAVYILERNLPDFSLLLNHLYFFIFTRKIFDGHIPILKFLSMTFLIVVSVVLTLIFIPNMLKV